MREDDFPINEVFNILKEEFRNWQVPVVTLIALQSKNPFKVLLSTIISLRTKDEVTIEASKRLYKLLEKPNDIFNVSVEELEKAIYPCGFYKRKAIQIKAICERLVNEFNSEVPKEIDTLLKFDGVGRKTANLVLSEGYNIPAMCVDVHVHRISNRLGFINTKTPEESEFELREKLPKEFWNDYNTILVAFGQSLCRPISPYCSKCPIIKYCQRVGVGKFR
ncbi:MAG: endonuclease III [Nanoarchaeota archaeon]|nr:endonuclease III [Nanoarchaeota archaeon]